MIIAPNSNEAAELIGTLKEKLKIPDNVISFSVHFSVNDPVKVIAEYYPESSVDDTNKST